MTGPELLRAFERLFGEHWRIPAAAWLGVNERTLERQVYGSVNPRGPVVAAVEARLQLEQFKDARRRAGNAWFRRNRKLSATHIQILTNARDGVILITGRPPGGAAAGTWEAATVHCVNMGWLDDDRRITAEGLAALERGKP